MGRYSTINEQFRPMSYQEMLAPVQMADTEHKNLEQSQADLAAASIQWEDKLKNETDPTLRNLYQGYADNLRKEAETLASKGLDGTSRRGLLDLRTQYARDIMPIEEAYKKYQAELARRQQLRDVDASTIFEKGDLNITGYYNNPETQYKAMKVDEVYKTAAADFGNYATKFLEKNIGNWKSTAFGQMLERRMHSGATEEQILDLIKDDPNAPEELKKLYDTIKNQSFERGNWSEEDQTKIIDALNRGAIYGIGSIKSDLQKNENFVPYHLRPENQPTPTNPIIRNVYPLQSRNLEGQEGKDFIEDFNRKYMYQGGKEKGKFKDSFTIWGNQNNIDVPFFDENGKIFTREKFIEINSKKEKAASKHIESLKKTYDTMYKDIAALGLDVNEGVTKKDIQNALDGIETFSTNTMNAIEFTPEDSNVNGVLGSLLTKFSDKIQRVSSWDKHGTITLDPKKVDVEEAFEKQPNTTEYKQKPNFFIPPNKNTKGIFIRYNGENYYIANTLLGDTGDKAQEKINQAAEKNEELKKLQEKQTKTQKDINDISKLEQILANIDSEIIAIYNVALQLSYDKNKVKTYNSDTK